MRNGIFCAALIGGLAIIAFSEHHPAPAVASPAPTVHPAPAIDTSAFAKSADIAAINEAIQQLSAKLDNAPTTADLEAVKQQVKSQPQPKAIPPMPQQRQVPMRSNSDAMLQGLIDGIEKASKGLDRRTDAGEMPDNFVSFPLRRACGPNGCGEASQYVQAKEARGGVPGVRQVRYNAQTRRDARRSRGRFFGRGC